MDKIFKYCVEHPKLVNLVFALIMIAGALAFFSLKRDSIPQVDLKMMFVTTVYPGAAAKDVEINVSIPIEEAIQDVTGIKELTSYSTENFSQVFIEIDPYAKDVQKVKDDIKDAVGRVSQLPPEVTQKPLITEIKTDVFPVFEVGISGNVSELELRRLARNLEKKIQRVKGVASTSKIAYRKREVHVNVDLDQAIQKHVSLTEVMGAIRSRNIRVSGGDILSVDAKKKIITMSEFDNPTDVSEAIIRSVFSGRKVIVSDVATVTNGFEDKNIIVKTNGDPGINIVVNKKENADAVRTAKNVRELLKEQNDTLPQGVSAQVVKDYSIYVNSMLKTVVANSMIGFVLVMICLMFFLDKKIAFWTAMGIPFSLLVGFFFMPRMDIEITTVSMLAIIIVLGMLVDDAIVVAENIFSYREKGLSRTEASIKGVSQVFWPVVATVSTTIAAFIPIMLMGGIFGAWIRDIPLVITIVLLASLFESIFILPSHIAHTNISAKSKPKLVLYLEEKYKKFLFKVLHKKYRVIGVFILIFIIAVGVILPMLGFTLFASSDNDYLFILAETKEGIPIEETSRKVEKIEKIVKETVPKEVLSSYVTLIGKNGIHMWQEMSSVTHTHLARVTVNLTPTTERKITADQILKKLEKKLNLITNEGFTKIEALVQRGGPPVGQPVDVAFIGEDDKIRDQLAADFVKFLENTPGIYAIERDDEKGKEELNIKLNYGLMADLGITAADVATTIRAAFDGSVVTSIRNQGEEVDFRVKVADKYKSDPKYIKNLTIPNRMGQLIKLGSLISFEESRSAITIIRMDSDRSVSVLAEMRSDKIKPSVFAPKLKEKVDQLLRERPGFRAVIGGEQRSTDESMNDFFRSFFIAILVIYIILVVLFDSFSQPVVVLLAFPFGLIGVVFAFAIHLQPLSFLGLIGILGLLGVVVNNSLVMINFLNHKQKEECGEKELLPLEKVVDAAVARFRPIVLTTVTTVLGLMPSLYGFFGGRLDFLFPLLLALSWGLVFSTFITLFLIPAIYLVEKDFNLWVIKKRKKA